MEKAYEKYAKDVTVNLKDDELTQLHAKNKSLEELSRVPQWIIDERMYYSDEKAAFLSITSSSPVLLKDVDPEKLHAMQHSYGKAYKEFADSIGVVVWHG